MIQCNPIIAEALDKGLLSRCKFNHLGKEKKEQIMLALAKEYSMCYKGLQTFQRWGQSTITGLFEKDGYEFVFIPEDVVTLGWDRFAEGFDEWNQSDIESVLKECEYEGTVTDFLKEVMSPVRTVTISPMLAGRTLKSVCWEQVPMDSPYLLENKEWMAYFHKAASESKCFIIHKEVKFEQIEGEWQAYIYHPMSYGELKDALSKQNYSLPTADEWAYICGGGCRTIYPFGDNLDLDTMHLYYIHDLEKENDERPYDMEEANFFGLSIAYDPYKRELTEALKKTTCGGDGGCYFCDGYGIVLSFLPCSPHYKSEEAEDDELNGDYNYYRPIIRI